MVMNVAGAGNKWMHACYTPGCESRIKGSKHKDGIMNAYIADEEIQQQR